ncbi:uncharacterized protein LOC125501160 isoform X1 [Athalia rosae]|uniref:uncharacterized protein LOC125501160 isoform X1 n=1 Tax=Athalia rosae TaxID=37344 RepID=UPI002033D9E7|nr:uncharacterized protein LOC125501160 isoform X1 [Athalia rosae]
MLISSNVYAKFLYFLVKISGMAPFVLENNRVYSFSWKHLIFSTFHVVLCVSRFIEHVLNRSNLKFTDQTVMIQLSNTITAHVSNFGSALFPLIFLLKREKLVKLLRAIQKADDLLVDLGVEQNYERYFRPRAIGVGLTSFFIVTYAYGCAVYWYRSQEIDYRGSLLSLALIFCPFTFLVSHHGVLLFANAVDFLRIRYEQLNGVLRDICSPERPPNDPKRSGFSGRGCGRSRVLPAEVNGEIYIKTTLETERHRRQEFRKIGQLSHHLHDLTEQLVDLFSLLIIVSVAHYSAACLTISYQCFVLAVISYDACDSKTVYQLLSILWWLFVVFVELFYIAIACSRIQRKVRNRYCTSFSYCPINFCIILKIIVKSIPLLQAAGTALTLHEMWIKHHPVELKNEIQMLSLQLLQRPLTISAFGFFSLDYSYLYKIFCAMVAYFVIMVQLDSSKSEPSALQHQPSTWNVTIPI